MVYHEDSRREACKEFEQDLVLYYYGECAGMERTRLETHLEGCAGCRSLLEDLRKLLPLTVTTDEPPELFWKNYSEEIHRKLSALEGAVPWWKRLFSLSHPLRVPAFATAMALILALVFTLTKETWRGRQGPVQERELQAILGNTENLEFFNSLEFLESMDLLEAAEGAASKRGSL
jgi:hypothetical protein